jgi:hypothetical protein
MQYAGRRQGLDWTTDDYPSQSVEDLANDFTATVNKVCGSDRFHLMTGHDELARRFAAFLIPLHRVLSIYMVRHFILRSLCVGRWG